MRMNLGTPSHELNVEVYNEEGNWDSVLDVYKTSHTGMVDRSELLSQVLKYVSLCVVWVNPWDSCLFPQEPRERAYLIWTTRHSIFHEARRLNIGGTCRVDWVRGYRIGYANPWSPVFIYHGGNCSWTYHIQLRNFKLISWSWVNTSCRVMVSIPKVGIQTNVSLNHFNLSGWI